MIYDPDADAQEELAARAQPDAQEELAAAQPKPKEETWSPDQPVDIMQGQLAQQSHIMQEGMAEQRRQIAALTKQVAATGDTTGGTHNAIGAVETETR